ncbi:ETC complex I subunit [Phaeovibrio sulfidiphilus]|uniref:ETC complex I subunit n=1 Tax=Phaeovibrio sulfidiphilus TaxID=1220600 RepID=A0A8J6YPQ2_9PROT|nr:NADH dehydrogenase ubiquinone Fe-S protein 4 [Phaeovibrio sulfidiphilus]MBE1236982.1 ETC complex I subunit [Phaeovibrio sulfidiphilus]
MTRRVRLSRPSVSVAQSASGNSRLWQLTFEPTGQRVNDPLTGWCGSRDVARQVTLRFETRDQALHYARKHRLVVEELPVQTRAFRQRAYADNFAFRKVS